MLLLVLLPAVLPCPRFDAPLPGCGPGEVCVGTRT